MITALILGSCALAPALSALLCALTGGRLLGRLAAPVATLAAGFILALGLGHILPEAMEDLDAHVGGLFALGAVLVLAVLEILLTSGSHDHGAHRALRDGGGALLTGSALHTLCDGVVIASAYLSDPHVGMAVTLAILCHETPHELGDYALMLNLGMSRRNAFCVCLTALCGTVLGGLVTALVMRGFSELLPYALAVSASTFIYVALCDLLPRLRREGTRAQRAGRCALLLLGAALCLLLTMHE